MKTSALFAVGSVAIILALGPSGRTVVAGVQTPARGVVVTHIGVVVNDVARSARAYADLVGTAPPPIETIDHGQDGGPAHRAELRLGNVVVELLEPVAADSPLRTFLARRGQGVHHIGLSGGRGSADLAADLGLQLHAENGPNVVPSAAPVTGAPLARPTCITHLGIAVRDISEARRLLADALGVEGTPVREFTEARGQAHYTAFNLDNVSIELLAQAGDGRGNYADFVEDGGPRPHHVGIHLRRQHDSFDMQEQIAWLEAREGRMAVDADGFAYIDHRPQLGLLIEALSPTASDRVYPHPHATP